MKSLPRRAFLQNTFCTVALAGLAPPMLGQSVKRTFTAAIIGHTGHGNYGHGLDAIFNGRSNVKLLAVADPDPGGRDRALERTGAPRGYADYREMLEKEKPRLVSVAPRWTEQHHAMAMAALRSGAHVFIEKPFTRTLAEGDDLLRVATGSNLKIAVAHQMRLAPSILFLKRYLDQGGIGALLEMRAHGKQDRRAGGEDLLVLGVHLFHLMRFFAGDPVWCAARVLQNGRDITRADAHAATEGIGPVAGDEILAHYAFSGSVNATFTSRAQNRDTEGPWGMELIGSHGRLRILADIIPRVFKLETSNWSDQGKVERWSQIEGDPMRALPDSEKTVSSANKRLVDDWLEAIAQDREPVCSGKSGRNALEMVMAVFAAGVRRTRVEFPLSQRTHPLEELRTGGG